MKIDKQIAALIPAITSDERKQLRENLVAEGCRDPLVVWRGTLLDGHNRLEICQERGIAYRTVEIDLPDLDAAKVWVIRNQLGRRNITKMQRAELVGKLKPLLAAKAKEREAEGGKTKGLMNSSNPPIHTRKELAKIAGLSEDTMRKAEVIMDKATDEDKQALREGRTSINKVYQKVKPPSKATQAARKRAKEATARIDQEQKMSEGFRAAYLEMHSHLVGCRMEQWKGDTTQEAARECVATLHGLVEDPLD